MLQAQIPIGIYFGLKNKTFKIEKALDFFIGSIDFNSVHFESVSIINKPLKKNSPAPPYLSFAKKTTEVRPIPPKEPKQSYYSYLTSFISNSHFLRDLLTIEGLISEISQ